MYLGLDIGTSAVKAVLVKENGEILGKADSSHPIKHPKALWSEQDPLDWVKSTKKTCHQLKTDYLSDWNKIKAVGLSGQMHGSVFLDDHDKVIRPAILWNDGRSFNESKHLKKALPEIDQISGVFPMPGFTAPKVMWLEKNEAHNFKKIKSILLPKDYIRFIMSGDKSTDCADAAGTLWFNQNERKWSEMLCSLSSTKINWLPKIYEGTEFSSAVSEIGSKTFGLKKGIKIVAGGGDASAGACGVGAVSENFCLLSLGTSGQLFTVRSSYLPPRGGMVHSFAHCIPKHWFHMACMLNGARPLSWWAEVSKENIKTLIDESQNAVRKNIPIFLPYLTGERTPHNNAHIRGAFYGIENATGRAELTRSILEAITFSFVDAKEALIKSGSSLSKAAVIGGGSKSDFLMQLMANQLETNLIRYKGSEIGPAVGVARLCMVADGISYKDAMKEPIKDKLFSPENMDSSNLDRYRLLYNTLKPFAQPE